MGSLGVNVAALLWMAAGAAWAETAADAPPDAGAGPDGGTGADAGRADAGGADAAPHGRFDAGADGAAGDAAAPAARDGASELPPPPEPAPVAVPLTIRVLQKGTRKPLAGAAITVNARPAGETDPTGRLAIAVTPGVHQVEAQFPAHAPARERLEIAAGRAASGGEEPDLLFRLVPVQSGERFESTVRVGREELPRVTVSAEEARSTAGTSGDPLRVLAALPGVSQVVWPAAVFVIRGSNPGNTGFFIDGVRVPSMFHLALGPSVIHPSFIGGLDFYPGAYPESFGRYVAGIVSIRTEPVPADRVHVSSDVTAYDARALATAPLSAGRGSVAAAARYSFTGPLLSLFDSTTSLRYGDYQLRVDHRLWGGRATAFAFGSLDELRWDRLGTMSDGAALQFHRLDLRWTGAAAGGRLIGAVTGGADAARSTLYNSPISVQSQSLAPRLVWSRPLPHSLEMEVGADAELQRFDPRPAPFQGKLSDLARVRRALSQGAFASIRFTLGERLQVTPGVRTDLYVEEGTSRFLVQPRLATRVVVGPRLTLKLDAGQFSQMASLPVNVAGFESFGLASIGLQRSDALSAGIRTRAPGDIEVDVTGYGQRMRVTDIRNLNLIDMMPQGDDYLALREGLGTGVEVMVRRPSHHRVHGWLAYTLSWSYRVVDGLRVRSDWDQRHILNLVGGWRVGRGYSVGARLHFHTGRMAPLFDNMGSYVQLPNNYRLDLRAERRFYFDRLVMDLYIDIANATFQKEIVQYVYVGNGESVPQHIFIVLPTIGVHVEL